MKNLYALILSSLIVISCGKGDIEPNSRDCREVEYNSDIVFQLSDKVCFPDQNSLTIINIEHGFCPCSINCDWEGGLLVTLSTSTGDIFGEKKFYGNLLGNDRSIFANHEITSFSYIYDSENQGIPACAEDFEAEKITLTLSISPL